MYEFVTYIHITYCHRLYQSCQKSSLEKKSAARASLNHRRHPPAPRAPPSGMDSRWSDSRKNLLLEDVRILEGMGFMKLLVEPSFMDSWVVRVFLPLLPFMALKCFCWGVERGPTPRRLSFHVLLERSPSGLRILFMAWWDRASIFVINKRKADRSDTKCTQSDGQNTTVSVSQSSPSTNVPQPGMSVFIRSHALNSNGKETCLVNKMFETR